MCNKLTMHVYYANTQSACGTTMFTTEITNETTFILHCITLLTGKYFYLSECNKCQQYRLVVNEDVGNYLYFLQGAFLVTS